MPPYSLLNFEDELCALILVLYCIAELCRTKTIIGMDRMVGLIEQKLRK